MYPCVFCKSFFVHILVAMQEEVVSFPLYTEAIKLFHHEESMVRIAVRTITLSVYNGELKIVAHSTLSNVLSRTGYKLL